MTEFGEWQGELGLTGWWGRTWTPVIVIGETPKRYRIKAVERMKLAGRCRWLEAGKTTLVPKHAIRPMPLPEPPQ